ncbi:glycosyl hydrolase 43 family protein [Bacteroides oleiciplenus]|uniref:glycosyl hydrolase 43 family protein n=1 Tax=Bacteroides oleiciplenus TaxID=626931 RepID=UPI0011C0DF6A|nr:glycosyl hydrolase 43 family protein [Bacteroides oleiciplenus]
MKKLCLWLICTMLFVMTGCANTKRKVEVNKETDTFTNPFIFADVPDVDVIRINSDYFRYAKQCERP